MEPTQQPACQARMHICLVCHTEPDVWDSGFYTIDHFLRPFLDRLNGVRDSAGGLPRVAWCLTAGVMSERASVFCDLARDGHEMGVHSHYPHGAGGSLEHSQELNRRNLDQFDRWLPDLCALANSAGLPAPRVHVTWMFVYRDHMTRTLAANGIAIDCSVCYGGAHYLPDRFLLADSRRRETGKPYWLSFADHCLRGSSPVVELPVSGGFEDYWQPDGKGGFDFFYPTSSDGGAERQLALFRGRLDALAPAEVDVFHIHFHLYGFGSPSHPPHERMARAVAMLETMAADARVRFSTPSEAVADWVSWQQGVSK